MQQIIAELTVRDMATSIGGYMGRGFSFEMEGIQDEQGFQWVSMGREGRSVWLLRQDISRHDGDGTPSITFYLQVENVDRVHTQLISYGIKADTPPQNQWYGLRDFIVHDPDGFCWAINQSISPDECPPHPKLGRRVRLL